MVQGEIRPLTCKDQASSQKQDVHKKQHLINYLRIFHRSTYFSTGHNPKWKTDAEMIVMK